MKRSLLAAAFLATTALTPAPARADPVTAFFYGVQTALTGATVGATVSAAFMAGYNATVFLTTNVIGRALVTVGLNYAINRLTRQPQPRPQDQWANFAQPVSYATTVYGRTRTGGPLGFTGFASGDDVVTGQGGAKRHFSPVLAMHPIHGIVEHILGDTTVELDGNGTVITSPYDQAHYRIRPFLGQAGQVADPELVARFSEITSDHDFLGLGGAHIWCRRPKQEDMNRILDGGRPQVWAPVIDGKDRIWDPRTETFGWTRNAALIIADWAVGQGHSVDWDEVAVEADACDLDITIKGGATRKRWCVDTILSDDQDYETQRAALQAACDAWFYERPDGKVGFRVGRWIEPDITLTDRDFYSIEKSTGQAGSAKINRLSVKYTEPANRWKETPTADLIFDPTENDLTGEDPQVFAITEHNQAFRVARRMLAVRRAPSAWRGTVGLIGYWLSQRRFWRIEHSSLGFVYVEVQKMERHEGGMAFDFEAVEVAPGDFEPEVADIEPDRVQYQRVESDGGMPNLAGLAVESTDAGTYRLSWTAPEDESLRTRIRIREDGDLDWQNIDAPAAQVAVDIPGLVDGTLYEVQGAHMSPWGTLSPDWYPITPLVIGAGDPGALTGVSVTAGMGHVGFGATTSARLNNHAVRVYRGAVGAGFGAATQIGSVPAGPAASVTGTAGDPAVSSFVVNGGYGADTDWSKGTGWSIAAGVAAGVPAGSLQLLSQDASLFPGVLVPGDDVRLSWDIVTRTAGNLTPRITAALPTTGSAVNTVGRHHALLTVPASPTGIGFAKSTGFNGSIDNVVGFVATPACLPAGPADYWLVAVSAAGVEGPPSGPVTLDID